MNIQIQARNFSLTDALKSHVRKRIKYALNAGADQIQRIQVRLSDINGPRGGVDKRCLIQVSLAGNTDIIIADTHSDLYAAIGQATGRLSKTLSRKLNRLRRRERTPRWQLYYGLTEASTQTDS
jgi:putative sigma-54 modulation protein